MTTDELIKLLEGATEGSRDLDARIGYAVDLIAEGDLSWRTTVDRCGWEDAMRRSESHQNVWSSYLPHYSTSVDAALTLVPEGDWGGEIMWNFGALKRGGYVELNLANPAWMVPGYNTDDPPHAHLACVSSYDDIDEGKPDHPRPLAIALCIASLRARTASQPANAILTEAAQAQGEGE